MLKRSNIQPPATVAAIDLGSNSFHMIVVRVLEDGRVQVVDRLREMVRLANGLDATKKLTAAAQEQALACLERFGQRLRELPPGSVRAVGTNTLRTARNSRDFLRAAQRALGHPIEVIAGREEARLIYQGVAHSLANTDERRLVMDIGGGSTEFIVGQRYTSLKRESLYMGCVTMSNAHFGEGVIKPKAMRKAEITARLELQSITDDFTRNEWERALGASGTIRAIGRIVLAEGWSKRGITQESLLKLREAMLAAGHVGKLHLKELDSERAPVFPGGVAILIATFGELKIDYMEVSDGALREGLVYDLIGRIAHQDVREATIQSFVQRYDVDVAQAERVERTAFDLLAQVAPDWGLDNEEAAALLRWSARLHELGLAMAHSQYHKHGAYILAHSDLAGFSRQEQDLLAALVRGHRRKFPQEVFNALLESEIESATRLCVLLRLAVLLRRSQHSDELPPVRLSADPQRLKLEFPADWLSQHPLTQADLENEQNYLQATAIKLEFA